MPLCWDIDLTQLNFGNHAITKDIRLTRLWRLWFTQALIIKPSGLAYPVHQMHPWISEKVSINPSFSMLWSGQRWLNIKNFWVWTRTRTCFKQNLISPRPLPWSNPNPFAPLPNLRKIMRKQSALCFAPHLLLPIWGSGTQMINRPTLQSDPIAEVGRIRPSKVEVWVYKKKQTPYSISVYNLIISYYLFIYYTVPQVP